MLVIALPGIFLPIFFYHFGPRYGFAALAGLLLSVAGVIWVSIIVIRYIFVYPIIMFEGRQGYGALKRSGQLGQGLRWRIVGVLVGTTVLFVTASVGIDFIGVELGVTAGNPTTVPISWVAVPLQLFNAWFNQVITIAIMALYVDLAETADPLRATGTFAVR